MIIFLFTFSLELPFIVGTLHYVYAIEVSGLLSIFVVPMIAHTILDLGG